MNNTNRSLLRDYARSHRRIFTKPSLWDRLMTWFGNWDR